MPVSCLHDVYTVGQGIGCLLAGPNSTAEHVLGTTMNTGPPGHHTEGCHISDLIHRDEGYDLGHSCGAWLKLHHIYHEKIESSGLGSTR